MPDIAGMAGKENASEIMLIWRHRRIIHLKYPNVHRCFIHENLNQRFIVSVYPLRDDSDRGGGCLYICNNEIRGAHEKTLRSLIRMYGDFHGTLHNRGSADETPHDTGRIRTFRTIISIVTCLESMFVEALPLPPPLTEIIHGT